MPPPFCAAVLPVIVLAVIVAVLYRAQTPPPSCKGQGILLLTPTGNRIFSGRAGPGMIHALIRRSEE